ncbi:hypothetical protein ACFCP7_24610 [Paenibacillus elgii]
MNNKTEPCKILYVAVIDEAGEIKVKQRYDEFRNLETRDIKIITSLKGKKLFESLMELKQISSKNGKLQFNYFDAHPNEEDTSASILMGKVAELIILNRCIKDKMNRKYAKVARNGKRETKSLDSYLPVTASKENDLNTNDSQIDIFWVKKPQNGEEDTEKEFLLKLDSDNLAGLQVKFSTNGLNYIFPFLRDKKYNVPMMYFGIKDDYDEIRSKMYKHIESSDTFKLKKKKEISEYIDERFVNMKSFDRDAFDEAENFYPMIKKLVKGKMKIDDLLDGEKIIKQSLTNYIFESNSELIQKAVQALKQ